MYTRLRSYGHCAEYSFAKREVKSERLKWSFRHHRIMQSFAGRCSFLGAQRKLIALEDH